MDKNKKIKNNDLVNDEILEIEDLLEDEDFYFNDEQQDEKDADVDVVAAPKTKQSKDETEAEVKNKTEAEVKNEAEAEVKNEAEAEVKNEAEKSQSSNTPAKEKDISPEEVSSNAETVNIEEDEIQKVIAKAEKQRKKQEKSSNDKKSLGEKEEDSSKIIEKEKNKKAAELLKKNVSYVNSNKKIGNDNEYLMLISHLDELLSHLPKKKIEEFAQSKYFNLYTTVIEKIKNPSSFTD